jgi:hypothetical protein
MLSQLINILIQSAHKNFASVFMRSSYFKQKFEMAGKKKIGYSCTRTSDIGKTNSSSLGKISQKSLNFVGIRSKSLLQDLTNERTAVMTEFALA